MKEFIEYLIKNLVEDPHSVQISLVDKEEVTIVEIRVAQPDIAKLVGRQGRTINALRTIAMTIGARFGRRVRLEVMQ